MQRDEISNILARLVSCESVTPHDVDCQNYMIAKLEELGFRCQRFDNSPVSNFYAEFGTGQRLLIFAGHTDVVPVGDITKWQTDPFVLHDDNGMLFGRGVADMKGSLAAMLVAAARFVNAHPNPSGKIGFLITSGEEGNEFELGTPYVMRQLQDQGIHPDYCIVGEPSSSTRVGDIIKIGRRGSLIGQLTLHGKQGHVAYPHLALNPIHAISPALDELITTCWDEGNAHFPPTSFQITHVHAGGQANNIIPGDMTVHFNFRYSTEQTAESLKQAVQACFERHGLAPIIQWTLSGEPFLTAQGRLLDSCVKIIRERASQEPELSTTGGTSDGRFIAPYGVEVIELGPVNATIHQVNECVSLDDLCALADFYYLICHDLL
ncbi:MAG: succinyl-diaminopimelate desuccinylase [Legionellaceae bacterium]|nr:succinyl-diaminopimelate desuccinylase [Legionellaceae bacterium]